MPHTLRIAMAQLNLHVGNIDGNLQKHLHAIETARDTHQADLIVFPELSICGYPPEDLLLRPAFIKQCEVALQTIIKNTRGIYCLIGHPIADGGKLYNSCSLIYDGHIVAQYSKLHLPNYGVFDEKRYFDSADKPCVIDIKGIKTGVIICEDVWSSGPMEKTVAAGAKLVLVPNASPFVVNKHEQRMEVLSAQAKHFHTPIVYVNNVGGQDELVFDGGSLVVNADGSINCFSGFFAENISVTQLNDHPTKQPVHLPGHLERVYQALVLGTRDYIEKNQFPGVLIGISGGIDSALTAAIAVDALGADRVHGVFMPSAHTSDLSEEEANKLTALLGIDLTTLSIEEHHRLFTQALGNELETSNKAITDQNIQSRCRAVLLMALSNASGNLVLTTGNRSELAVGYCTLYGDMCGGYAPLKNIPKTMVYQLAEYRNTLNQVIPPHTIQREPSAELAPGQKDSDSLPPYSVLDPILELYINYNKNAEDIIAQGFDKATVNKVIKLIRVNEYKRRQYAVGPQIYLHSFIKDWRYPITNGF